MDNKAKLLFGVHMHQPVNNFSEAVDEAVFKCYEPFFNVFKKYPSLKIAVHCSGWLLEYIKKNHKVLFKTIKELSLKGQIEHFSAGFYEPVLSSIPQNDRISQIEKLNKTIKKEFLQDPKGAWLTERVWDDFLISDFSKVGIKYAMVDDYHLIVSGFDKKELEGYFISENNGDKIALFPINKKLRYAIPFKNIKDAIEDIKACQTAIIFDDLEKFGLWPGTYEWVYQKGWLENFFDGCSKDKNIISMHFNEYYNNNKQKSLAYLQNVSYYEMGEWSLKTENALKLKQIREEVNKKFPENVDKFVRGGTWKNFFIKYEESNRLHKRMIELSKSGNKSKTFLENLYKLQTNDVFWHGVFGGIYLPNLRDNAYHFLSKCENIRYKNKEIIEAHDNDMNGFDEVKIVKKAFIVIFDSHYGGQMVELINRDKKFNFQNVISRREEAYHEEIINNIQKDDKKKDEIESIHNLQVKIDDKIKNALSFDWYVKNSFIDHISDDSFTLSNFKKCCFKEYGDFANQPFEYKINDNTVVFKREGGIYLDKKFNSVLYKKYDIFDDGFDFIIDFKTISDNKYIYAIEFNLHFADLDKVYFNDKKLSQELDIENIKEFFLVDEWTNKKIIFSINNTFKLLLTPLQSVSKSEKGYDLMTQGVSFAFLMPFCKNLKIEGKIRMENV